MTPELKLWDHQREIIKRAVPLKAYGIFAEMGTGKTCAAIQILRHWYTAEKRVLKTLVLGPPIIVQNWKREIQAFSKVGDKVVVLDGTGKNRERLLQEILEGDNNKIVVTNYETLLMFAVNHRLGLWSPEVIIFDESHKLKNVEAKRTKLAIKLADGAPRKLILTGTPILNTPMDMFSQFRVMDGGATFGRNFFVFRAQYFYDKNAGMPKDKHFPLWLPRPGAFEELHRKIQPVSMVVKKSECLDLPPLVRQTIYVELSKEQAKLYNAMKKDFVAYVNGKACVAQLAITKALRLLQISSGFVTLEGEEGEARTNVVIKDNPRAQALREVLGEITSEHKCIVWAVFRQDFATIRAVCEELSLPFVEVHGAISAKRKQEAVDSFNNDPAVRVFIGHPGSGGIGINLVSASYAVYYSRSFSLEEFLQSSARNYRSGSEQFEKITQIDIIARGTIDELVAERLASKQEVSSAVLHDLAAQL